MATVRHAAEGGGSRVEGEVEGEVEDEIESEIGLLDAATDVLRCSAEEALARGSLVLGAGHVAVLLPHAVQLRARARGAPWRTLLMHGSPAAACFVGTRWLLLFMPPSTSLNDGLSALREDVRAELSTEDVRGALAAVVNSK